MSTSINRSWILGGLLAAFALAFALAIGASAPSAYAAPQADGDSLSAAQIALDKQAALETQASTKTVKSYGFKTETAKIKKKALKVKKGTTKFKLKGNSGYLCFKAPKTKK